MDLGFKIEPQHAPRPRSGPFRVRIEAGQMWVAPARISGKTLRDANQFMFCGLRYRRFRRLGRLGGALSLVAKNKPQTHLLRNEAQLNCVALRPPLDYVVAWRPVKGQDERQKTAPLTALHATRTQRRR